MADRHRPCHEVIRQLMEENRRGRLSGLQPVTNEVMMTELKCTSRRRLRAGLVLLALVAAPVTGFPADSAIGKQKPEPAVAVAKAEAEPSLAEIATALEALEAGER